MIVRYPDGSEQEIAAKEEAVEVYRHSTAHLMALAVSELYPEAHLGIGPATSDGFYYDFQRPSPFTEEDIRKIDEKMRELIREDLPYQPMIWDKEKAVRFFAERGEELKVELIKEKAGDRLSCYRVGNLVDFCLGPHVQSTGKLGAFKLLNVAGAYWRGNENNPQLQRIYGIAFLTEEEVQAYLDRLEEARKRDHRKLGRDLDLFSVHEEAGAGLIYWHPKGALLRYEMEQFLRSEQVERGYQFVEIPHIAKSDLWRRSGHYDFFRQNMYVFEIEEDDYGIKPMNCPGHILIYRTKLHSYRDLPIRLAEFGTVYRYEKSGVLHGTLRVRGFTQDDAHIFCTPEQAYDEVLGVLDLAELVLKTFGFDRYEVDLSTWDPEHTEKYAGGAADWAHAEQALQRALEKKGYEYRRMVGEAAFYGPKIDVKLIDALGRAWQATTVQFDFNLPQRLEVHYIAPNSKPHPVIMIHRALFGSLERFIALLLEHYAGALPLWLSPVQVLVIPISERFLAPAETVALELKQVGIRARLDDRNEKMGFKIREAQLQKIPYMLVVGQKEVQEKTVSVRNRFEGDLGPRPLAAFVEEIRRHIQQRSTRP
ncbi:MAG: threonine--tRNA ligase [Acidobacteria bacterium]|nr:threonine--tRNA ligase [Acidobacteriota bacterium]